MSAILASVTGTVTSQNYEASGVYPFPGSRFTVKSGADFGYTDPSTWAIAFEDYRDYDYNDWYWIATSHRSIPARTTAPRRATPASSRPPGLRSCGPARAPASP